MKTLSDIIDDAVDVLAPNPDGSVQQFDSPLLKYAPLPNWLPETVHGLARFFLRELLAVRMREMLQLREIQPRDRATGETAEDSGYWDELVLDEADEGRFLARVIPAPCVEVDHERAREVAASPAAGGLQLSRTKTRTDNLKRAIFDAWDKGMRADASASEVFDYLATKDDTGYIRGRDRDELKWENSSGTESVTTLKALANRLPSYRTEYDRNR